MSHTTSTIKVGISASLSGQFQTQGRQALAGLKAWARDVNLAGGLETGGRLSPLEVISHDDASLASGAEAATLRLIKEDRVRLLFGPYSSGLARAAAWVAQQRQQVLWNQGGAAEGIYQPGGRVVGILSGASEYLSPLPPLFLEACPFARSFAILRCSVGDFSRQVSNGLEAQAVGRGMVKVLHREYAPEKSDFFDLAQEALAVNPDLLLAVGRIRHDIAFARCLATLREGRTRPMLSAVVAAPIDRFRRELGNDVEGFVGPSQWEPPINRRHDALPSPYFGPTPAQAMLSLREAAASEGGLAVDYPMVQAYAAGLVAQRCVVEAGSLHPDALWETAGKLDFHTFFGRFKIDPDTGRQLGRSVCLVQWQAGRKVVIWPPEQSQGKLKVFKG